MTLPMRLKVARKAKGVSQAALAKGVGLRQSTIASLESGRSVNSKYLPQIAQFLGVSYDWLLTGHGDMHFSSKPSVDTGVRMVPVWSMAELLTRHSMRQATQYLPAPPNCSKDTYAVPVESDAMTNRQGGRSYPPGTLIYVDPDLTQPQSGQRVIAELDGYAVFKEYRTDGPAKYLISLNPSYPAQDASSARILGTVIGSFLPE